MKVPCPGCGGEKSPGAELCASCRKAATAVGASVITAVGAPTTAFTPRTPRQNAKFHGRLSQICKLEKPSLSGEELWKAERRMKHWALKHASRMVGRTLVSSVDLSEIEMERVNDWLGDVIDGLEAGERRPR